MCSKIEVGRLAKSGFIGARILPPARAKGKEKAGRREAPGLFRSGPRGALKARQPCDAVG
jgi:hypothetical protein